MSEQLVEALHTTYPMGYTIPYGCVIDNSVAINPVGLFIPWDLISTSLIVVRPIKWGPQKFAYNIKTNKNCGNYRKLNNLSINKFWKKN